MGNERVIATLRSAYSDPDNWQIGRNNHAHELLKTGYVRNTLYIDLQHKDLLVNRSVGHNLSGTLAKKMTKDHGIVTRLIGCNECMLRQNLREEKPEDMSILSGEEDVVRIGIQCNAICSAIKQIESKRNLKVSNDSDRKQIIDELMALNQEGSVPCLEENRKINMEY